MDEFDLSKVPQWLGITVQQFEILRAIHSLEISRKNTSPKNILEEYKTLFGKELKKNNLFVQMKPMVDNHIIEKVTKGVYTTNISTLNRILKGKEGDILGELENFKTFSSELKDTLEKIALRPREPVTNYIQAGEFFNVLADSLKRASSYHGDSPFPNVSYSHEFASAIGRADFVETQLERCFKKGELKINYITNLNVKFPFFRALRVFGDIKKAYKEVDGAINQLERQVEQSENFDIRYINPLPGPHGYVLEYHEGYPVEVFLASRGSNIYLPVQDPYGGVHIRSPDVAKGFYTDFLNVFELSTKLKEKEGKRLIKRTRSRLKTIYKKQKQKGLKQHG